MKSAYDQSVHTPETDNWITHHFLLVLQLFQHHIFETRSSAILHWRILDRRFMHGIQLVL